MKSLQHDVLTGVVAKRIDLISQSVDGGHQLSYVRSQRSYVGLVLGDDIAGRWLVLKEKE